MSPDKKYDPNDYDPFRDYGPPVTMTDDEARADHTESCGCDTPIAVNCQVGGRSLRWLHLTTQGRE